MEAKVALTRALLRLLIFAAVVTAPAFLAAERLDTFHLVRIGVSHGCVAIGCLILLRVLACGRVELVSNLLVFGLFLLIAVLASTNREDVHVNVVNFVLVTVLAATLLGRRGLAIVAPLAAVVMVSIAWRTALPSAEREILEARLESIFQFLPTYLVITIVLWIREPAAAPRTVAG